MIKLLVLLWILVKSTFTSFAGLASLPEIREELVEQRHWLTDDDLNQAVVITRTTPGPVGLYVVSVGFMADGVPGAVAGWIAMASPSLLVILLVGYFGKRAQQPRVRAMLQCVVLASAALLVVAAIPIGREALDGPLTIAITAVALPLLITKRVNTLWIIGGAAALSFAGAVIGVAHVRTPGTPILVDPYDATHVSSMARPQSEPRIDGWLSMPSTDGEYAAPRGGGRYIALPIRDAYHAREPRRLEEPT